MKIATLTYEILECGEDCPFFWDDEDSAGFSFYCSELKQKKQYDFKEGGFPEDCPLEEK